MEKVIKGGEGAVNIWLLREKDFWNDICQSKHPSFEI